MKYIVFALIVLIGTTHGADTRTGAAPPTMRAKDLNLIVDADGLGKADLTFQLGSETKNMYKIVHTSEENDVLNVKLDDGSAVLKIMGASSGKTLGEAATTLLETERLNKAKKALNKLNNNNHKRSLLQADDKLVQTVAEKSENISYSRMIVAPKGKLSTNGKIQSLQDGKVTVQNENQWKMVVEEDFTKGTVEEWVRETGQDMNISVNDQVSTCAKFPHGDSDYFLGAFSNVRVKKTFALPFHEQVRITARVHFLDMWEGEIMYLKTDNGLKWSRAHKWCKEFPEKKCQPTSVIETGALDSCGDPNFSDTLSVPVDISFPAEGKSGVTLEFGGALTDGNTCKTKQDCAKNSFECNQGFCVNTKATWGLDDVRIYIK